MLQLQAPNRFYKRLLLHLLLLDLLMKLYLRPNLRNTLRWPSNVQLLNTV